MFLPRVGRDGPTLPPGALWQAVLNLLRNAAHAIPEGEPDDHRITLTARRERDQLVITMQDTGVGMSSETLSRAPEAFFSTRKAAGMGLTIVQQTADAADGSLDLVSAPGRGTTATLRLPLKSSPG